MNPVLLAKLAQLVLLGGEAFTRWLAQHAANEGKDHGELLRGALGDYAEGDKVMLEIMAQAGAVNLADGRTVNAALNEMRPLLAELLQETASDS